MQDNEPQYLEGKGGGGGRREGVIVSRINRNAVMNTGGATCLFLPSHRHININININRHPARQSVKSLFQPGTRALNFKTSTLALNRPHF